MGGGLEIPGILDILDIPDIPEIPDIPVIFSPLIFFVFLIPNRCVKYRIHINLHFLCDLVTDKMDPRDATHLKIIYHS